MQFISFRQEKISSRCCVISTLLLLLLFIAPLSAFEDTNSIDILRQMSKAFAEIAEKASPAVVGIKAEKTITQDYPTLREWPFGDPFDPFEDDFFDHFFRRRFPRRRSPKPKSHQLAQGSGFIISPDGYILTNNHLVGDTDEVIVNLVDGQKFTAKIIGTDPESDVAVIKIDADGLHTLELADSDALEVGEWVIAIGNPFGLNHTVTAGIVSAKGRSLGILGIRGYEDFIQTDAAINPGNSGGPLLNLNGKVVGINTAIVTGYRNYRVNIGIGFAIPVNIAKNIYEQLIDSGTVTRGFLGVIIQDLTPELADSFGLENTKGVLIPEVTEDSAADKAGIKQGDIVVELDGQPVEKAKELQNRVAMLKPGAKVKIIVLRNGERETLTAELGKRPPMGQIAARSDTLEQLGFSVQGLTDDLAERFGYEGLAGVVVTKVEHGSLAELAGIKRGTLIMEVNRKTVENTKDFDEAMEQAAKERTVLLRIKDERYTRFVVLKLPEK